MTSLPKYHLLIFFLGSLALPASLLASPYGAWAPGFFTEPEDSEAQPLSDADGDGLVNLLEYAFATNPTEHNVSPVKERLIQNAETEEKFLQLSFPRLPGVLDLAYEVRVADRLEDLQTEGEYTVLYRNENSVTTINVGAASENTSVTPPIVTVTDTVEASQTPKRFMRLVVRQTPSDPSDTASTYEQWVVNVFPSPNGPSTLPSADPDRDGIINLFEYAFGSDPMKAQPFPIKESIFNDPEQAERFLQISFPRRSSSLDLTYEVRVANRPNDLAEDGDYEVLYRNVQGVVTVSEGTVSENTNVNPAIVTVGDTVPLSSSTTRFMRLVLFHTPAAPEDVAPTYGEWAMFYFESTANPAAQPFVDSDADGFINLLEYAFATNPIESERTPIQESVIQDAEGSSYLQLRFPRRLDPSDLTYEVRVASSPAELRDGGAYSVLYRNDFGEITIDTGLVGENLNMRPPVVTINDTIALSEASRRFVRLVITPRQFPEGPYAFLTIGDPGNDPDVSTRDDEGSVDEIFQISKYEITNDQYAEFLNAMGKDDPAPRYSRDSRPLYDDKMGIESRGGIIRAGQAPNYTYTVRDRFGNKPVNFVSYWDACRFCNWLHNGKPSGAQDTTTTEDGAYDLTDPDSITDNTVTRKSGARYFIPTQDEWHKAAYFQSQPSGGRYSRMGTRSNELPVHALADEDGNIVNNDEVNLANYGRSADWDLNGNGSIRNSQFASEDGGPTTIGSGGRGTESYYGISEMTGNVWEWNDTITNGLRPAAGVFRRLRGGGWESLSSFLDSRYYYFGFPTNQLESVGFRIAAPVSESSE